MKFPFPNFQSSVSNELWTIFIGGLGVMLMLCFFSLQDCGWKGWGEISYGGHECVKRAKAAEFLVDKS